MKMLVYSGESQGGSNKLRGIVTIDMGETDDDKIQSMDMLAADQ
jgi:hypothetical protein